MYARTMTRTQEHGLVPQIALVTGLGVGSIRRAKLGAAGSLSGAEELEVCSPIRVR
jgi:hypothetical protein